MTLYIDKRWKKLGEVLANYCLEIQPGQKVAIAQYEVETWPLALALFEAAVKAGGFPQIQLKSEHLRRAFMKLGSEAQYSWAPELEIISTEWADCYAALRGGYNLDIYHDIPADVLAANQKAHGVVSSARWNNTRWVITRVPNAAFAQQAGLDLETVMDMYFNACLLDWEKERKRWVAWSKMLAGSEEVRMTGYKTDLRMSVKGRTWGEPDARFNLPGAEMDTSPIVESVNGYIYFENPGVLGGRQMNGMALEWKNGNLVKASASTNEDYLHQILATDPGASRVGEFSMGLNQNLTRFTKDIFWDEKMYGTAHIALGRADPRTGGKNPSIIHWDIVKDLRHEGEVIIDGRTVLKDGRLLFYTFS